MKTRNKVLILTSVFILGFISSFNPILASSDINYAFESDVMYSNDATTYTEYNVREGSEFTGHYNATYSFENDIIGSVPEGWNNESEGDCSATVINELDGHSNVLNFTDNDISEVARLDNDFPIGIISNLGMDFWIQQDSVLANTEVSVVFYEGVNILNYLVFQTAQLSSRSWDIGWYALCPPATFVKDVWYHINLDFDDSANLFNLSLNGILYDNNDYSLNSTVGIDQVRIFTKTTNLNYAVYFDAIGYSWDGYNATYSFNSDVDGSNPSGWSVDESGGYVEVINEIDNHYKVVHLNDSVNGDIVSLTNFFSEVSEGTIELWLRLDKNYLYLEIMNSYSRVFWILFSSGQVYVDGGNFTGNAGTTQGFDVWFHCKLDFNHDLNLVKLYINGEHRIDTTFNVDLDVNKLFIYTHAVELTNGYVDGVGYSWDSNYEIGDNLEYYAIGDNLIPYKISNSSIQEIDVYSFSYTESGDYTEGTSNVPFWDEVYGSDDSHGYEDTLQGVARVYSDSTFDVGIYKDDFTLLDGMIDIRFHLEVYRLDVDGGVFYFNFYSEDTTLKTRLRFLITGTPPYVGTLSYYDGASYNDITTLVERDDGKNYTLTINPSNLIVLKDDSGILEVFEGIDDNKGLSEIEIIGQAGVNGDDVGQGKAIRLDFNHIGIYSNGTSLSVDYMSITVNTNEHWDSNIHNLFYLDLEGYCFSVTANSFKLYDDFNYTGEQVLNVWDEFTGGNEVEGWISLPDVYLTFVSNDSLTINYFSIEGLSLTDGTTTYYPELTYDNIDIDESYFYVLDNKLMFTMTTDDSDLEYMEITFDVGNIVASNRSLKWSGVKSASSLEAQFKVIYTDSSYNPFELEPDYKNLAVLLPRTKTIDTFGLLISDDDSDVNDTITGYIGSFELLYVPLITTDFVSISFFDALPIVVLVVVIPIALYVGFGRKKELLVPSIVAMSIFGTAVGLIPLWLTFVIGFGCVAYFIMDRRN